MIEGNVDNALANLPFGSHLGLIYQGPTDWLPLLATAIRASLQRGERWIHFADANTVPSLRYALQAEGVNLDGAQRWGVFRFITPREWLGSETREPHGLLDGLPRHVDEALACGLAGLRVSVEVSAFLATLDDPRQWTDFEFAINTALPGSQSSGIFLYSQLELSVTRLRAALYLHPLVMLDNRLYPSIYYVPPEAAADEVAQRFHLNSMFERIRQTAAAERMQARERPQGVISELVAEAFGDTDLTRFAQKAAARVATCLGTEYTKVLELLPGGTHLLLRAGVGWRAGLVNHATVDAGIDSQAGYTLLANQPVIVDDLRTETRFHGPPLLVGHRVVSGMSTIIHGRDRPWGVLGTHTITRRRFTDDEVSFLQAVADVLSLAVERRQLADAHAQLIAIVESSTTAIIGTDRRGVIVGWNPGAESLLGFAPAEVVGQTISILVPAGPGEVPDFLREWIERGESVKDRDTTLLRSDGQLVDVSLALSFTGPEGGAVLVVRDMTDQKRLESERAALLAREQAALARAEVADAVRKNEARFHRLVENIQDYAITLVDPQGRVASWNDGAQRIFGYREDEVLGKHISLFYTPEDLSRGKAAGRISHAADQGRFEQEGWRVRKDGSRFRASIIVIALHDDAGRLTGFASVVRDLSNQNLAPGLSSPSPFALGPKVEPRGPEHPKLVRILPTVPIFRDLLPDVIDHLADVAAIKQYRRGQFIFLEEDPIEALHVLVEGHVKMIRETEDGREVILRVVCPSEVFGIAGFGAQMAQRFSAQANEDATVIEIPTEEFIQILSVSPPSLQSTLRTIGALLREVESRICDLQTKDAESRLAGVLAQLATSSATPAASVPFTLALTRQDLADLAGTNLSTASRTVSAWAKAGFLSVGRAKIVVRDVGSLAAIARGARLPEIDRRSDTGR